jgi:Zn-dependent protease
MWRRDYGYEDDYGDYGGREVRRTYVVGGGSPDSFGPGPSRSSKLSFSPTELRHLSMAIGVLSVAFTLALSGGGIGSGFGIFLLLLIIAFICVSTGFALHEIAHKYVAEKYGHWAEFRYSEMGLLISLMAGFIGFIIFIPGAVYISGNVTREQNGKISAAGPLTNVALALIFWGILFAASENFNPIQAIERENVTFLMLVGMIGAWLNTLFAGFNMIPLHPLDGSKIVKWNIGIYIGMLAIIIPMVYFGYTIIF